MHYFKFVDGSPQDTSIAALKRENPSVSFPKTIDADTLAKYGVYPYTFASQPAYNEDTQTLQAGTWGLVDGSYVRSWTVVDLSAEEIAARVTAKENDEKVARADPIALVDALEVLTKQVAPSLDTMDVADVTKLAPLFKPWKVGVALAVNEVVTYEGEVLKVIQAHTTQADWIPTELPALYTTYRAAGSINAWVQPAGAHDAYQIGDKVTHQGSTWQSTAADNVWEPGVFGWTVV